MALALTRRVGEEIILKDECNEPIIVKVVSILDNKVRLSFKAPRNVEIWRRELLDQKEKGEKK